MLRIEFDSGAHGKELRGPLVRQVFLNSNVETMSALSFQPPPGTVALLNIETLRIDLLPQ